MVMDANYKKKFVVEEADSILIPKINIQPPIEDEEIETSHQLGEASRKGLHKKIFSLSFLKPDYQKKGLKDNSKIKKKTSNLKKVLLVLLIIFIPLIIQAFFVFRVYQRGLSLKASVENLVASVESQNLDLVNNEIINTKTKLHEFNDSYKKVSWMGVVPFVGKYIKDGQNLINASNYGLDLLDIAVDMIVPYADIFGFNEGSEELDSLEETTQDKLDYIVKTLPELVPKVDNLAEKIILLKEEIDEINPDDYPITFAGYAVKERVRKVIELTSTASDMIRNVKPLLEVSPYLMGVNEERTYLIIFQNDKELRPTGGFITAYSIAKVINGKFEPTVSDDIYNLDNKYVPHITAPQPIIDLIKGPYLISKNLRLRDMNWSPDFKESMDLFSKEIEKAGIKDIDGIIAVDTHVLVNLLDVLGPIDVPGYGVFSNEIVPECNCSQVIYELESFADIEGPIVWSENEPGKIVYAPPNYDNRKKIIGPLMNSILSNMLGQSNEKIPALFEAAIKSLSEKNVLFYLHEESAQKAVEEFGIGGIIKEYEGDYLHINDANLGGRKSNLYVTQEVVQEVEIDKEGGVYKTLTITYKNPEKHDGWLNSILPNWVRIYVPQGSELISIDGLEKKEDPYEELGKTVFAGFFELRPLGVARVVVKYKLPFKVWERYSLFIQKQPGKDYILHTFKVGDSELELFLRSDREFDFKI